MKKDRTNSVYGHSKTVERFWEKVQKGGPSDCWQWTGSKSKHGYGMLQISYLAHRFAMALLHGEVPVGMDVLHSCDNTSCVNPKHLWFGTPLDNALDKERKGRGNHPRGESSGRSKLTSKQVLKIRAEYPKLSARQLGKKYNVSHKTILAVVNRKVWTHI